MDQVRAEPLEEFHEDRRAVLVSRGNPVEDVLDAVVGRHDRMVTLVA